MFFLGPKADDKFYLRLLLTHVKGAVSFEDIRTINGVFYSTYKEAAIQLGLTFYDGEYQEPLEEVSATSPGTAVRSLFVVILLECSPVDPAGL